MLEGLFGRGAEIGREHRLDVNASLVYLDSNRSALGNAEPIQFLARDRDDHRIAYLAKLCGEHGYIEPCIQRIRRGKDGWRGNLLKG